jgi:small conductance mechanosensitive channel
MTPAGGALDVRFASGLLAQSEFGPGLLEEYWPAIEQAAWFSSGFLAVFALGWFVVAPVIARVVERRNRNNPTIAEAITRYFRVFVALAALFVGAGVAGFGAFVSDSALVIAAGTLAIGVAGQAVIGSLISGLVLVFDPEFNVGNYVECEAGSGTVQSITLRVTRLHTTSGELVTVPNTVLTSQAITRPFIQNRHRIVERVRIAYDDDLETAITELEATASDFDAVIADPPPRVYAETLGGDGVELGVTYWIDEPRNRDIPDLRSRYITEAKAQLEDAGITISPASKRDLSGQIEVTEST